MYRCKDSIYVKLMGTNRLIERRLLCGLALVMFVLLPSGPTLGQNSTTTRNNGALDPRAHEAQRRLVLAHRRKQQILQNAQYYQMLTARQEPPVTDATTRRWHRPVNLHRAINIKGRGSGRTAAAPGASQ